VTGLCARPEIAFTPSGDKLCQWRWNLAKCIEGVFLSLYRDCGRLCRVQNYGPGHTPWKFWILHAFSPIIANHTRDRNEIFRKLPLTLELCCFHSTVNQALVCRVFFLKVYGLEALHKSWSFDHGGSKWYRTCISTHQVAGKRASHASMSVAQLA